MILFNERRSTVKGYDVKPGKDLSKTMYRSSFTLDNICNKLDNLTGKLNVKVCNFPFSYCNSFTDIS